MYAYAGLEAIKARYDRVEFGAIRYMTTDGSLGCADSDLRMGYYHAFVYPTCLFDGGETRIGANEGDADGGEYEPIVLGFLDDPTPVAMRITDYRIEGPAFVTVEVMLTDALDTDGAAFIRACVLEDGIVFEGRIYNDVLCDFEETPLIIDQAGETQVVTLPFGYDASGGRVPWEPENCWIAAMVQQDGDQRILQSCGSRPAPAYAFRYYALGRRLCVGEGEQVFDELVVYNTGSEPDTLSLSLDAAALPPGWQARLRAGGDDFESLALPLAPGESAPCRIVVTTAPGSPGGGTATLLLRSLGGSAGDRSLDYTVITPDTEILLVDDDGAENYESAYFAPALAATGHSYAIWDRKAGVPDSDLLSTFRAVVWSCGGGFPVEHPNLSEEDRAALGAYLDAGGALFASGQDIAWELSWGGWPALVWMHHYLGADFAGSAEQFALDGVPGDPIGDGIGLVIQGGDGADNQYYHCKVAPFGNAQRVFAYAQEGDGAVRKEDPSFRSVLFGFGFEGIDNAPDRTFVMQRIIAWLLSDPSGTAPAAPARLELRQNLPNPFNPETRIGYVLGEAAPVTLSVFDLEGRLVRVLDQGPRAAGAHEAVWDGTDAAGRPLASGMYFYRLDGGGETATRKMLMLK